MEIPLMGTYKAVARNASGEGHATINLTFEEGMKIGTNILLTSSKNQIYEFRIPNIYNWIFIFIFSMILRTHFNWGFFKI